MNGLSYANVVATLALFLTLGGTRVAPCERAVPGDDRAVNAPAARGREIALADRAVADVA